jgi:hypothetical protein
VTLAVPVYFQDQFASELGADDRAVLAAVLIALHLSLVSAVCN